MIDSNRVKIRVKSDARFTVFFPVEDGSIRRPGYAADPPSPAGPGAMRKPPSRFLPILFHGARVEDQLIKLIHDASLFHRVRADVKIAVSGGDRMDAKAAAVKTVIKNLYKDRDFLQILEERLERHRAKLRPISYLPSCRALIEMDRQQVEKCRREIQATEAVIAALPDDFRELVTLYAQGESWTAICARLYISETTAYRRFRTACHMLYEPMRAAGLIQDRSGNA